MIISNIEDTINHLPEGTRLRCVQTERPAFYKVGDIFTKRGRHLSGNGRDNFDGSYGIWELYTTLSDEDIL
jgi:hypothetical protein